MTDTASEARALSPCPFCGGDARLDVGSGSWGYTRASASVSCSKCHARSAGSIGETDVPDDKMKAEAIGAWNRRISAPAVAPLVARLRGLMAQWTIQQVQAGKRRNDFDSGREHALGQCADAVEELLSDPTILPALLASVGAEERGWNEGVEAAVEVVRGHPAEAIRMTSVAGVRIGLIDREAVLDTLRALRPPLLASADAEERGWQPIETAPKKGPAILVCADGYVSVVEWDTKGWICVGDGSPAIEHMSDFGTAYRYVPAPTHWQPLPAPPAQEPTATELRVGHGQEGVE